MPEPENFAYHLLGQVDGLGDLKPGIEGFQLSTKLKRPVPLLCD